MRPAILCLLITLGGCAGESAEPAEPRPPLVVRATVDRSLVVPGDPFTYTVEMDWADGVSPAIPEFGKGIERLRITDQAVEGPDEVDGRETQLFSYTLVADKATSYEIPGVTVSYMTGDGEKGEAATGTIFVEARQPEPDEDPDAEPIALDDNLRDIRAPYRLGDPNVALWLLLGLAAFVIAAGLWFALVARRWRAPPPPAAPPDPDQVALADLASLRQQGYLQRAELQPFAFGLSSILRTYLGARFAFPAPEWTTTEILRGLPPDLRSVRRDQEIRRVLDATDLVKYAGRPVAPAELEQLADLCADLVRRTRGGLSADEVPR
ncbi:MAG: BatD family protein [Myxococcota bacterium]|nr:BatD family protein [Myxococcota bacterium]